LTEHNLSDSERLLLSNRYAILEKLDSHNADHYAKLRKILQDGYTILYGEVFRDLSGPISSEECHYVFDVLDMYRTLPTSYEHLSDKSGVDVDDLRFRGFDGNNESNELSLAKHL
jgi:uncharacterized protein YfbU (UPF0304 family)